MGPCSFRACCHVSRQRTTPRTKNDIRAGRAPIDGARAVAIAECAVGEGPTRRMFPPYDSADEATGGHRRGCPEVTKGELLTPRLRLRPVGAGDLDAIADLNSDPEVMRTITGLPSTRAESAVWLERHLGYWAQSGGLGAWRVDEQGSGSFLGRAVLRPFGDEVELGYALHRRFWGRGYATEAGQALLDYGIRRCGLERVVAHTIADNVASQRVLVKLGFRRQGEVMSHAVLCPFFEISRAAWVAPPVRAAELVVGGPRAGDGPVA